MKNRIPNPCEKMIKRSNLSLAKPATLSTTENWVRPNFEREYQTTGALCETCHDKQASENKEDARHKGIHPTNVEPDESMKQNDKPVKWVTCQSCHNVHSGNPDTALLDKGIKDAESLCKTCHQRQHANDKDAAHAKGVAIL
jgi:predicted CXXCH cytochrome family protein